MKCYKLTDQNWETYGHTKWGPGITHTASGEGELCTKGWLHAYTNPLLAVLLNPQHAYIDDPVLWEAEAGGVIKYDHGLKIGCTSLTTLKIMKLPNITKEQKTKFAILCAKKVCNNSQWLISADNWLSGVNRLAEAARAAEAASAERAASAWAAESAALAAASAERAASAWAAESAARAAAWAAAAAVSVETASAEAAAARAAAWAAAAAARAAAWGSEDLDLIAIAEEAIRI